MRFRVITLFPGLVEAVGRSGVVGRAIGTGLAELACIDPRRFTDDVHQSVDDRPFGGGPGMVMKVAPLARAVGQARGELPGARVVLLSPQGAPLQQARLAAWQGQGELVLVAGRYEGVDERLTTLCIDEEISLGDFVLSGGEIGAMAIVDAVTRLVPGVLGHRDSAGQDSFGEDGLLDCPHYTRPDVHEGLAVPSVLLSGDHARIRRWRRAQAVQRTWERRPDLLVTARLDKADIELIQALEAARKGADGAIDDASE